MILPLSFLAFVALSTYAQSPIQLVDIDDVSTPPIVYTGAWSHLNNVVVNGAVANFYQGTTSNTVTPGDKATLTFTGVQVAYWADKDVDNANVMVTLDGTSTTLVTKNPTFLTQQLLFNATGLANTAHTLEITHNGAKGEYMNVDRIQYGVLASTSSAPVPSSPSATKTSSASGSSVPSGAGLTNGDHNSSSNSKSNNAAIIAGTAAGGVLVVAGLLGSLIWYRRRKRDSAFEDIIAPLHEAPQEPSFPPPSAAASTTTYPSTIGHASPALNPVGYPDPAYGNFVPGTPPSMRPNAGYVPPPQQYGTYYVPQGTQPVMSNSATNSPSLRPLYTPPVPPNSVPPTYMTHGYQ